MAPRARAGGSATLFEVDLHGALPILTLATVPLAVRMKLARSPFTSTHRRLQVMPCRFPSYGRPDLWRSFTPSRPASTDADDQIAAGDNVLPFNSTGAVFIFALYSRRIPGQRPFALPVNFTTAVEIARRIGVHLDALLLLPEKNC